MPKPIQTNISERPPRIKLAGSILVLLRMENGRQLTAKLHQISVTGGLIHLPAPLDEGIKVEVMFHVENTIRTKARMLFPMWATQGCLQPFQFVDLPDSDRLLLEQSLEKFTTMPDEATR